MTAIETTTTIADVRPIALAYPEPHGGGQIRHISIVRIETTDGHVGWGEAITGREEASHAVNLLIEQALAPLVMGKDPGLISQHLEAMRLHTFWYGTGGLATMAISAIDVALWDLAGQIAGVPVHKLLGGKRMDRVRLCASVIWDVDDMDAMADWCRSFLARGYTAMKAGWGRRPEAAFGRDPEVDVALARLAREAIGPEMELTVDVAIWWSWTLDHAIRMAHRLHEFDLAWLEDALVYDDYAGYAKLRAAAPMAIGTGERLWRPNEYKQIFAAGAADLVLIDPGRVEGISGTKATAELAAAANVQWVPHSWSSAINTAAALHVFASTPNGRIFELKPDPSPMQHELVRTPFAIEDGHLAVPDGPGLGIEVDEEAVARYGLPA
jgi:L-alanine-DL-glutamate epimerase-like enolase superfamily enzyme